MNGGGVFSGRSIVWLFAIGGTAFIAILLSQIFGDRLGIARSFGPDPSSVSAIGTRAFMKVLDRLGVPVLMASEHAGERAGSEAVLVITDPRIVLGSEERRQELLSGVERAIVVLPKWAGAAGTPDNRWIGPVQRSSAAEHVWNALAPDGSVKDVDALGSAIHDFARIGPSLPAPQLVRDAGLEPLLAYEDGILIGEMQFVENGIDTRMIVLSDPDLIANHNLDAGDNAVLAVRMVERIRPPGAALVFAAPAGSGSSAFWQRLFMFPYAVFTLQAVLALIVVIWAGTGRFGSPLKAAAALGAGRAQLIANAADLLDHARHGPAVLGSYARAVLHDVAHALNAPRNLDDAASARWLDEAARRRGKPAEAASLFTRAMSQASHANRPSRSLVRIALALHHWKQEMTDDAGRHSRP